MRLVRGLIRFVIIIIFIGCIGVEAYLHGAFDFVEKLDKVASMEELTDYINEELRRDIDQFDIYVENVTEEQIKNVNRNLDGFFGNVTTYTILGQKRDGMLKVRLKVLASENLEVWKLLVEGKNDVVLSQKGQKLYDQVSAILHNEIQEGMSDFEKEKALHDYLIKNCAFEENYRGGERTGDEDYYKAYGALVNRKAVCNGYAEAMNLLLNTAGISCKMVVGTADGTDHAWNIVKLSDGWYQVDATWDDPTPDREGMVQYDYFNLTDEQMAKSHQWNREDYEACTQTQYNYFIYYNQVCSSYEEYKKKVNQAIAKKKKKIVYLVTEYEEGAFDLSFVVDSHLNIKKASYMTSDSPMGTIISLNVTY